jgi:tRNA (cmo5U34)-methyltransferase
MLSSEWQNEVVVESFLNGRRSSIPFASEQLNIMLYLISHLEKPINTFIDIGAGDGILSHLILDKFKYSKGCLIDFSQPMIEAANKRLNEYLDRIKIIDADISNSNWQDKFNDDFKAVDLIVSGYCIHHLPHGRKYEIYQEIYNRLSSNGIFINVEHVASKSSWGEKVSDDLFIDSAYSYEMKQNNTISKEEISKIYHNRPDKKDNILLSPETQCEWLREIGFKNVDIYFKIFELAVFAGIK